MPKKIPKPIKSNKVLPATTPEGQESRMIAMAYNVVEQQMMDGTVSAQVLTHFLKLATEKTKLEEERLKGDIELAKAKTETLKSAKRVEELYSKAIEVMKEYSGIDEDL